MDRDRVEQQIAEGDNLEDLREEMERFGIFLDVEEDDLEQFVGFDGS